MGYTLKLFFVGNQFVAESWFITFEIDLASKYAEVSMAWFSAIAVLVGCCWVSILVSDILGWARIDNAAGSIRDLEVNWAQSQWNTVYGKAIKLHHCACQNENARRAYFSDWKTRT
jgi:hypothetical protein